MSTPTIFTFESHKVRIVLINGEPWFVAADVCAALNLSNSSDSLKSLDKDERAMFNIGRDSGDSLVSSEGISSTNGRSRSGNPNVNIISESGMYTLVLRCRDAVKPGTLPHRFRKWATGEVLPAIRKTGKYDIEKSIDVENLLLSENSTPTLQLTDQIEKALNKKSFELAAEAFMLIQQFMRRHVAARCEYDWPRQLNTENAMHLIEQSTLGKALAQKYYTEIDNCTTYLWMAKEKAKEAIKSIEENMLN